MSTGLGFGYGLGIGWRPSTLAELLAANATVLNDTSPSFTRATTAYDPYNLATVASGARRRRPLNIGGRTVMLDLIEGARTNLILQSQTFGTTWVPNAATITSDAVAAPDGTTTADLLMEDGANAVHANIQSVTKAASALAYSGSVCVKAAAGSRNIRIQVDSGGAAVGVYAIFNPSTGAIVQSVTLSGGTWVIGTQGVDSLGNGWYRLRVTGTSDTATTVRLRISLNSGTTDTYTGDDTSGVYLWGAQLEQAAFPSSYAVTTTVAVTRNADVLTTSGVSVDTTQGTLLTLVIPYGWTGDQDPLYQFHNGSGGYPRTFRASATTLSLLCQDSALAAHGPTVTHGLTDGTLRHLGMTWESVTPAVRGYVSGVLVASDTAGITLPWATANFAAIGSGGAGTRSGFGWVAVLYWPRALTAAELLAIYNAAPVAA